MRLSLALPRRRRQPPPAPFIVGVPRSGTTLLRLMLDAHSTLAIPPETHFVPRLIRACRTGDADRDAVLELLTAHKRWPTFELEPDHVRSRLPAGRALRAGEVLRAFYTAYAQAHGKSRFGDKTPRYLREMRRIQKALPEARFVHIIRDVRDVALSMTSAQLTMPDSVSEAARRWAKHMRRGRAVAERVDHYLEIRYEDLVLDTEPTLRRVCEFVELEWEPGMLDYHERAAERMKVLSEMRGRGGGKDPIPAWYAPKIHRFTSRPPAAERVGRWRTEMGPQDRAICESLAGGLLAELGYETGTAGAGDAASAQGDG